MYIATAAIGFRVIEKICFAYSFDPWQFYLAKFIGSSAVISASLIRSQLSKSLPVEDIGELNLKKNAYNQSQTQRNVDPGLIFFFRGPANQSVN